jgi:hypothetical protein
MKLTGENRSTRGEICPSATLSTTNSTWTDPGSNPGFRGERPAPDVKWFGLSSFYYVPRLHFIMFCRIFPQSAPKSFYFFQQCTIIFLRHFCALFISLENRFFNFQSLSSFVYSLFTVLTSTQTSCLC